MTIHPKMRFSFKLAYAIIQVFLRNFSKAKVVQMAQIKLKLNARPSTTMVSNHFIDAFMADANGEYVKIYLYLLRCAGSEDSFLSISQIADKFDHTEKDVKRALKYWQKAGLLNLAFDENKNLTGVDFLDVCDGIQNSANAQASDGTDSYGAAADSAYSASHGSDPDAAAAASYGSSAAYGSSAPDAVSGAGNASASAMNFSIPATPNVVIPAKPSYSADKLASMQNDDGLSQLLFISEQYLGKPLSKTEMETIFYFYDELHFSIDLIEYLIEYCVSKGSKSFHYIEKVALAWAEDQVRTVEDAKKSTTLYVRNCFTILKAFGIKGRNPIDAEVGFIKKWLDEYCFGLDIIIEACSRTVLSINKPSFEYADSILSKWKEKGVKHVSDIRTLDAQHQIQKQKNASAAAPKGKPASTNKFNNFNQRTYDYDQLEKQLLKNSKQPSADRTEPQHQQ